MNTEDDAYDNVLVTVDGPLTRLQIEQLVEDTVARKKNSLRFKVVAGGFSSIDALREAGAQFYDAQTGEDKKDYVMLDLWLKSKPNFIPPAPNAALGVSVSLRDDGGNRLLVKERYGYWADTWKPITGTARPAENTFAAAKRTLAEEVGLTHCDYLHTYAWQSILLPWACGKAMHVCHHLAYQVNEPRPVIKLWEDQLTDYRWFTKDELRTELLKEADCSIHERIEKWIFADLNHGLLPRPNDMCSPDGNSTFCSF